MPNLYTIAVVAIGAMLPSVARSWNLNPIKVKGQHFYDSVTDEPWHAVGIGFPSLPTSDVDAWISVLHRVHDLAPDVNLIRLYNPPCNIAADDDMNCKKFMQEADSLGIYALVPGTGTLWGYFPAPHECDSAAECYKKGGVLGWGQTIVQKFHFPNTLAIVIGNEFDMQTPEYMPAVKAYARDLKVYMQMCNENPDSPAKDQMRIIPLAYASSDDMGDQGVEPKMDYLMCEDEWTSVDIFGLNIERWCQYLAGSISYNNVNTWVAKKQYPGAFMFTEMGCHKHAYADDARDWAQLNGFFANYSAFNGFIAYAYYGNPDFDMFEGPTAGAKMLKDGENFFREVAKIGEKPPFVESEAQRPECPTELKGKTLESIDDAPWYDTGKAGWAPYCPVPPTSTTKKEEKDAAKTIPIVVL